MPRRPSNVLGKAAVNSWWIGYMFEWRRIDETTRRWEGWVEYSLRDDVRRHWAAGDRASPFPGTEGREWLPKTRVNEDGFT